MNNSELYIAQNSLQTQDVRHFLKEFSEKFTECKDGARVADLGCATGDATVQVLMPQIKNCISITGMDLAPELIHFAKEKFASANVTFETLDICTKSMPPKYINAFDKVFSFNCIHWVADKWQVFKNISDMLSHNGEVFLQFVVKFPVLKSYITLSNTAKWGKYLRKVKSYDFETMENADINDILRIWKTMFKKLRFDVLHMETYKRRHLYGNVESTKKKISAYDPFLNGIPENQQDDYLTDLTNAAVDLCDKDDTDNVTKFVFTLDMVIIHAIKI